jgi:hypothetical protein
MTENPVIRERGASTASRQRGLHRDIHPRNEYGSGTLGSSRNSVKCHGNRHPAVLEPSALPSPASHAHLWTP